MKPVSCPLKYMPGQWQTMTAGSPRAITSGSRPCFEVGRDELVDRAGSQSVPAAEPVAGAADDRNHASRVRPVQARGQLDAGSDAPLVREKMPEIMRNLGPEDVAAGFQRAAATAPGVPGCRNRPAW